MYGSATRIMKNANGETRRHEQTRVVELFMAGDVEHAKQIIRKFCVERPICVTVTPTTYIYRGGEEAGFVVGFRNYPRFPNDSHALRVEANDLGDSLRAAMGQDSYMVVDNGGVTTWSSVREQ